MARWRRVLGRAAVSLLLVLATPAKATGPSRATVELRPIAVSPAGAVLFKVWRELSPTGARAHQRAEVSWLVVSADGLWLEAPHATVGAEADTAGDRWAELLEEFRGEVDWEHPPGSVRPLLERFAFSRATRIDPATGRGAVAWSPDRLCLGSRCTPVGITQWATGGVSSLAGRGNPIQSSFHAAGVALFRCDTSDARWATPQQPGADFSLPPNPYWDETEGLVDIGYDLQAIDGISIVPKALRAPKPPEAPSR